MLKTAQKNLTCEARENRRPEAYSGGTLEPVDLAQSSIRVLFAGLLKQLIESLRITKQDRFFIRDRQLGVLAQFFQFVFAGVGVDFVRIVG